MLGEETDDVREDIKENVAGTLKLVLERARKIQ